MQYRRAIVPGGSFFFTLVTAERRPLFAVEANVDVLRSAFRNVKEKRPFDIDAIVIMPDHLHCIWTLPEDNADYSTRWRLIKTWFAKRCIQPVVWQNRFWEHTLRNQHDFTQHVEYIHYNPVKHGYVSSPLQWKYSSFHRYVREGIYAPEWGAGEMNFEGIGHE